ncbi:MAG: hypothetical protein V3S16_03555 [Candidatus Desulfatibia sp.]|uniref:hypothetical protein n=1 Tax=Candidatus Desulfatibia sp. TaxID=3101189 RepID=UPI002F2FF202
MVKHGIDPTNFKCAGDKPDSNNQPVSEGPKKPPISKGAFAVILLLIALFFYVSIAIKIYLKGP